MVGNEYSEQAEHGRGELFSIMPHEGHHGKSARGSYPSKCQAFR